MDSGTYAAYTGVLARTQALDTAANNLANANTNGFRAQREYFRGVLASLSSDRGELDTVGNAVNSFSTLGGTAIDLSQGLLTPTGNPLDLGLQGNGFFEVRAGGSIHLTRDGSFQRASDGTLITQHGDPVLNEQGGTIVVPTGSVHVSADGTISVSNAEGTQVAGRIAISNYAAGDLSTAGNNTLIAKDGATALPSNASVQEGALEGANQDAVHGTMQLMLMQRQAEMMQKALNVFSNDLDKTASEELGRV